GQATTGRHRRVWTRGGMHAAAYAAIQDVELVGACDLDLNRAYEVGKKFGVPSFGSLEEMMTAVQPSLVSVTTKEYHHSYPAGAALRAGAHVFCEKMMAHSLAEGSRMQGAAREAGRLIGVNYN